MQLIRIFGIFCVFCGCCFWGLETEYQLKKRWKFFQGMQELLNYLEKELTYHRTPLPEAFERAARDEAGLIQQLLLAVAGAMEQKNGCSFEKIWKDAIGTVLPETFLSAEEYGLMEELAGAFCASDAVMQKTLLERYEGRMSEVCSKAAETYKEKGGLYRRLSVMAGIFLVILLI